MIGRYALERLSRGIVLKRRLPLRFGSGRLFVSPGSALKYWRRDLLSADPTLFDAVSELVGPGDVVWDIGANVGLFAFAAAGLAGPSGKVLAIEPDLWLSSLLHRSASSVRRDVSARVSVLPLAVSSQIAVADLQIAARGRSSNSLAAGSSQTGGFRATQTTLCVTLDWLLQVFDAPDVLKIDVEGLEMDVLKSASRVLESARPRILCEVDRKNAGEVTSILRSFGYSMFDADTPRGQRKPLETATWNTVAFPRV